MQLFCVHEVGGLSLRRLLKHPHLADRVLAKYVVNRHLDNRGSTLSTVKHDLLGCQHLSPNIKGHLKTAWENLQVWEEKRRSKLRPPWSLPLWLFMTGLASAHGRTAANKVAQRE